LAVECAANGQGYSGLSDAHWPAETAELAKVVDTFANAIEVRDFVSRLRALEDSTAEP